MKIITRDNAHYLLIKEGLLKPKQKEFTCSNCGKVINLFGQNFFDYNEVTKELICPFCNKEI